MVLKDDNIIITIYIGFRKIDNINNSNGCISQIHDEPILTIARKQKKYTGWLNLDLDMRGALSSWKRKYVYFEHYKFEKDSVFLHTD